MKHNHRRQFQFFIIPAIVIVGLMALAVYMSIAYLSVAGEEDQAFSQVRSHSETIQE